MLTAKGRSWVLVSPRSSPEEEEEEKEEEGRRAGLSTPEKCKQHTTTHIRGQQRRQRGRPGASVYSGASARPHVHPAAAARPANHGARRGPPGLFAR